MTIVTMSPRLPIECSLPCYFLPTGCVTRSSLTVQIAWICGSLFPCFGIILSLYLLVFWHFFHSRDVGLTCLYIILKHWKIPHSKPIQKFLISLILIRKCKMFNVKCNFSQRGKKAPNETWRFYSTPVSQDVIQFLFTML